MNVILSLDRFAGTNKELAVVVTSDGRQINIPRDLLPDDCRVGDVLTLAITRDADATAAVKTKTHELHERLKAKSVEGDLSL